MSDSFHIQGNIPTVRDAVPVRFAHHKGMDAPDNHVLHINNYVEIYVFVSGDHRYIVENTVYTLRRGDIILINPREVHKALPLSTGMYERFYLLVDSRAFDGMVLNPLSAMLNTAHGNLISPNDKAREEILDMLYAISDCFCGGKDDQLRAYGFFMRLLEEIRRHMANGAPTVGAAAHVPVLLEQVLTYVAENTATIRSVAEIATALGMSPPYLSTYFSHHVGTPLKIYIQAKKIALAKDLLDKGADVTTACYDCGFNDCSYFIRVFKRYVGVTPLRYKQALTKAE